MTKPQAESKAICQLMQLLTSASTQYHPESNIAWLQDRTFEILSKHYFDKKNK